MSTQQKTIPAVGMKHPKGNAMRKNPSRCHKKQLSLPHLRKKYNNNGTPLQSATGRVCPAPLCAGSAQTPGSLRLRAPSGNRCPFPGGFGVRPATTVSLRAALAARQPVRLDARQLPSASGRLGHASRCCPATLPRGGLGVRTLWPGGGRRLPDAHRPFNLPYL
jgi:hypothetical protein